MALAHLLYGTAVKQHGGLLFTAKAAGKRGEQIQLTITTGSPLSVVVTFKGDGSGPAPIGDISILIPAGTTGQQLLNACAASANFKKLARVDLTGIGSDVVAILAATNFVAAGGLRQVLQTKLEVDWWEDRDQVASGAVRGFIFPASVKDERTGPPDPDTHDQLSGVVHIVVAMQGIGFEAQNVIIDQFRRALKLALKTFCPDNLLDKGPVEYEYSNALKPESVNSKVDDADLKVIAKVPMKWTEPSAGDEAFTIESINPGLYLEPLTDPLGPGGGEVLDTILTIEEE